MRGKEGVGKRRLRVTIVLPHVAVVPVGAYIVAYRYARELKARGHEAHVFHLRTTESRTSSVDRVKAALWPFRVGGPTRRRTPSWLADEDRTVFRLAGSMRMLPSADAVIATAVETAQPVFDLPAKMGKKYYLVQGFEDWAAGGADAVERSWRLGLHKIVISSWLHTKALELGLKDSTSLIYNGFDHDAFGLDIAPEVRGAVVGMLVSDLPLKGFGAGMRVLERVREALPETRFCSFGTGARPVTLPAWVEYEQLPTRHRLRALYNSMAVFLHTSENEGWAMPPTEAMACGAALVATANLGILEYARSGVNALVVDIGDVDALARAVIRLLESSQTRVSLARAGVDTMKGFSWARSTDAFEALLGHGIAQA